MSQALSWRGCLATCAVDGRLARGARVPGGGDASDRMRATRVGSSIRQVHACVGQFRDDAHRRHVRKLQLIGHPRHRIALGR
jgi:hypothetical protein